MFPFFLVLFIGMIIRLFLVGNPGFVADIAFWKSWSLAALDHGIVWTAHNTNINYPPGFIYILWLMGKIYSFIGNPHNYNNFWKENNFGFLLAAKSIAIFSDIIIAALIYWFFSQKDKLKRLGARVNFMTGSNLPLLLSLAFFLNPVVILDSALWGQVESLGILFTLIAIILLFYKKPLGATIFFTIGTMMKLQNIIYIPLYFLFIFRYFDLKTVLRSFAVAAGTFFLVNLPFLLKNDLYQVLYLMTVNSDWFPWLSLNAHNLWWIVSQAKGMQITDKITILGILNAKTVGLLLFSAFYLLSSILLFRKPNPRNLFLSLIIAIFAFFLFTTQSHERYSYPVVVLLLFLYPFIGKRDFLPFINHNLQAPNSKHQVPNKHQIQSTNRQTFLDLKFRILNLFGIWDLGFGISKQYFWILYVLLTLAIFFNIHTGLILNYPANGFYTITRLTTPILTILNSYFLILLFILLLPFVFSQISYWFLVLCFMFYVLSLVFLHSSYLIKGQVSLTSFKPIIMKQDYGILQVNKSVNSSAGWKSWERLSDDYFYYRKGFGTHANSELVFDINSKFNRFSTNYGVDTGAGTPAGVIFKIYGDNKLLFESVKMGRFDFPKYTDVNIKGVKHLKLIVSDGGDGINSDHADWFNPTLIR